MMKESKQIIVRRVTRLTGVGEAAKALGCCRAHLSMILNGKRESKRIRQRMHDLGIKVIG